MVLYWMMTSEEAQLDGSWRGTLPWRGTMGTEQGPEPVPGQVRQDVLPL